MKRNMTRKFTLALSSFMVAAVALTSATFAWFTQAGNAQIEQFDMSVSAAPGLKIGFKVRTADIQSGGMLYDPVAHGPMINPLTSLPYDAVDDIVYYTSITPGLLEYFTSYESKSLSPVSASSNQVNLGENNPSMLALNYSAGQEAVTAAAADYYTFEIFLLSQKDISVTLNTTAPVFAPSDPDNVNHVKAVNSLRLGFGSSASATALEIYAENDTDTNLYGPLDLDGDGYFDTDPVDDHDVERVYGEYSGTNSIVLGVAAEDSVGIDVTPSSAFEAKRAAGTYVAPVTTTLTQASSKLATNFVWTLAANTAYRLTLTVWIEGWDTDSVNEIGLSAFKTSIKFMAQ